MKYCPLCRSEYRKGAEVCRDCLAPLVSSLHGTEIEANPPVLLWIGTGGAEFSRVSNALREAQIPGHIVERMPGVVGALAGTTSRIRVLKGNLSEALRIADNAINAVNLHLRTVQKCDACCAEFGRALTYCPRCLAVRYVETQQDIEKEFGGLPPGPEPSGLKCCPSCGAQYRDSWERCTQCGTPLVPEELQGKPLTEKERRDRLELIWRGGDPVAVSRVIEALRSAGIQHHVLGGHGYLVFGLAMPQPKYEVRVLQSDAAAAKEAVRDIEDAPFLGTSISSDFPEGAATVKTPEAGPFDSKLSAATRPVWAGEDSGLAQILEDCLAENRIVVRRTGNSGAVMELQVPPGSESAAREIIREVIEGVPPA